MKYYQISFPGEFGQDVTETWSEKQILNSYYPYWCIMMVQSMAEPDLNEKNCIADWAVVHWAVEIPKPDWISENVLDAEYELDDLSKVEEFEQKRNYPLGDSTSEKYFINK